MHKIHIHSKCRQDTQKTEMVHVIISQICQNAKFPFSADTVGWATVRSPRLKKVGCWFVGGDDLTLVLHVL